MLKKIWDLDGVFYQWTTGFGDYNISRYAVAAIELGAKLELEAAIELATESLINHQHCAHLFNQNHGVDLKQLYIRQSELVDERMIEPDFSLLKAFREAALPHKNEQVMLTSSRSNLAERVLNYFEIRDCFREVICLDHCDDQLKHSSFLPFEKALAALEAKPEETMMVEDTLRNLKQAKKMGLVGTYIHHGKPLPVLPSYVDYQTSSPHEVYNLNI